jgi:hypothetical protein
LFHRHGQRRIAKIARCDCVVLEAQSRKSIGVPWAVSGTGNPLSRRIVCPRNHGRIAGGRRRLPIRKDCWQRLLAFPNPTGMMTFDKSGSFSFEN